jgi:hypothetical protein
MLSAEGTLEMPKVSVLRYDVAYLAVAFPTFRDSRFETTGTDYPVTQVMSQHNENRSFTTVET